jgi:hypothetical protein
MALSVGVALAVALPLVQPLTHRYTLVAELLALASWQAVAVIASTEAADSAPILTVGAFVALASLLLLGGLLAARFLCSRLGGNPALFALSWLVMFAVVLYIAPLAPSL